MFQAFGNGNNMSELSRSAEAQRVKKEKQLTGNSTVKKIIKYGSYTLLAIIICVATFVGFIYMKADKMIDKIGDNNPPPPSINNPDDPIPDVPVSKDAKTEPLTLLLLGTDYREETHSMNTDVIMIVSLNPETKSATLVSLPRDLLMTPAGLPDRKANYYYPYFYNSNKDTANRQIKNVFSEYLKVPIDYVVTINFRGFEQVIDELGSLTIDVDQNMRYVDPEDGTNINLRKGVQKLNGKQTLDFIRYRKSNNNETPESNDLQRNQRQQLVLNTMLSKLKSVGGILKLGQIIDVVGNNMKTDIPSSQIREMIKIYFGIEPDNITYIQPDGEWISPYIYLNNEDLQNARRALREQLDMDTSDPSILEPAVKPPVQSSTPPSVPTNGNSSGNTTGEAKPSTPPQNNTGQKPNSSTGKTNEQKPNGTGGNPGGQSSDVSAGNTDKQGHDDSTSTPVGQIVPDSTGNMNGPNQGNSPGNADGPMPDTSEPTVDTLPPGFILDNPLGIPGATAPKAPNETQANS